MELLTYIGKEWGVIGAAPLTSFVLVMLAFAAAYFAASWRFGGIIEHQAAKISVLEARLAGLPGGSVVEGRKDKRAALTRFITEGEALDRRARTEDVSIVTPETEAWATRVQGWLRTDMDETHAHLFTSDTGLPYTIPIGPMSDEQRNLARWIGNRNIRLTECVKALGQ